LHSGLSALPESLIFPSCKNEIFGKGSLNAQDLEAGTVRLEAHTTKNDDARPIYLPQILLDVLEQQWQEHLEQYPDCPHVFHRRGNRIFSYQKDWRKAITDAGIVGRIPHDFRRTAVRNWYGQEYLSESLWRSPATKPGPSLNATTSSAMET
jgi:integrase